MEKKAVNRALNRAIKASKLTRMSIAMEAGVWPSHVSSISKGTVPGVIAMDGILRALGLRLVLGDPEGKDLE